MAARTVLGVDEAGRGPVLGPLIVGGFAMDEDRLEILRELGVRDSKELAPNDREEIYEQLGRYGRRETIALLPPEIDAAVARGALNQLEARAFGEMIGRMRPGRSYVDACDANAPRFGALVRRLSRWEGEVVSRHKADRDIRVVGAASIVAKVVRDRAMVALGKELGAEVGSGYQTDPVTIAFLKEHLPRAGERPYWLRASWRTTARLMAERSARTLDDFTP
ncbi:MAG: ribonuclease HII [Thermoplasmata archaeon]|jgi:ribonuclease HII|nr:ribonuclease HII [Thermoplasmata archaeon]